MFFNFASLRSHEGKSYSKYSVLEPKIDNAQDRCNSLLTVMTKSHAYFSGEYLKSLNNFRTACMDT
jgi:hypothetical protein